MKKSIIVLFIVIFCIALILFGTAILLSSNNKSYSLSIYKKTDIDVDNITGYSNGYAICNKDNKFFIVDSNGNKTSDKFFNFIYPFSNETTLALTLDNNWVEIDNSGNTISKSNGPQQNTETFIYSSSKVLYTNASEDYETFGVKDRNGNFLTEPKFNWISSLDLEYNFAILNDSSKTPVMITNKGEIVTNLNNDCINAIRTDDFIICQCLSEDSTKNEYYLADLNGKRISENSFSCIGKFHNNIAPVVKGNKLCLISKKGEIITESSITVDSESINYNSEIYKNSLCCVSNGNLIIVNILAN